MELHPSDYTNISFPGLGIEVNPPRGIPASDPVVNLYGMAIALGLLLAVFYGLRRCKKFGLLQNDILDGVLWVTPFAILCARAYYVIFEWHRYADEPITALYIWEGGLAIYGGVIGAALGIIVFCKFKKIRLPAVLDIVSIGFTIGQCLGRWGNFFNREAFGAPTESFLRMGLLNKFTGVVEYYHPTFLYESLWNGAGFFLLHFLSKRRKYDGQVALTYVAWYGLGRAIIEGLRMDSLYWGPFRVSQLLAGISCVIALALLIIIAWRKPDPSRLYVHKMEKKWAEAAAAATAEEVVAEDSEEITETTQQTPAAQSDSQEDA